VSCRSHYRHDRHTVVLLNHLAADLSWRIAYLAGPLLALVIIFVRHNLPESPRWQVTGAGAMIIGGVVAAFFGVDAEGKSLDDVAQPLSVVAKPAESIFRTGQPPATDP
jgi:hypothetical protein